MANLKTVYIGLSIEALKGNHLRHFRPKGTKGKLLQ